MTTHICDLSDTSDSEEFSLSYEDYQALVMDLSCPIVQRLEAIGTCYMEDENRAVECLSTLMSQYQMSGIKNIEIFLRRLCDENELPAFFRLEAAKGILEYEELVDDDDSQEVKNSISKRNSDRRKMGGNGLKAICISMDDKMPTPCRVEAVCLLMLHAPHKETADSCFKALVNDPLLDCDFRYKCILNLEHRGADDMIEKLTENEDAEFTTHIFEVHQSLIKREFPRFKPTGENSAFLHLVLKHVTYDQLLKDFRNHFETGVHCYEPFMHSAQLSFLYTETNFTSYRILSAQYLLQKCEPQEEEKKIIFSTLLEFANDVNLDQNLRADACDVLMRLGDDEMKDRGREIIVALGSGNRRTVTVFENSQNVHVEEVEASVEEVLEFFATMPTMKVNETPITFNYVKDKVERLLRAIKVATSNEKRRVGNFPELCKYCGNGVEDPDHEYCSDLCKKFTERENLIDLALNRIELDRALYSKYNSSLANILIKVWTYVSGHEHEKEMEKRLIEELEEMSGTCSSGFASRLINVVSGFGEFNIRISWGDQIKANLSGRLNACVRNIMGGDSPFRNYPYLTDLIMLYLNEEFLEKGEDSAKTKILNSLGEHPTQKELVEAYLNQGDRELKIEFCLEKLMENTLNEMTLCSSLSSERQYFSLVFRTNVASIREEMYQEFKEYMDDATFDLYMRKAHMYYDGIRA